MTKDKRENPDLTLARWIRARLNKSLAMDYWIELDLLELAIKLERENGS